MTESIYCEHERTRDACEECAHEAATKAGRPVPDRLYQAADDKDEATGGAKRHRRE